MQVKGILFDLDGTLWFKGKMTKGANECLEWARGRGLKVRILTNGVRIR